MNQAEGNPSQGLLGATIGFFVGFAAVSLFGPTVSAFNQVMQLSPIMIGFLVAAPALSGSLLRIPFAAWVDTTGGRKPFLILLSLSMAGMLGLFCLIALTYPDRLTVNLYPLLLFFGILSGCGIATFSVGISQVSYWFPQHSQGRSLGTYAGVGNLAPGFFSFLLPLTFVSMGFAGSYLAWLIFLMLGTVLYGLLGKNAWYFQLLKKGIPREEAKSQAREEYGQEIFPSKSLLESLQVSARAWKTWILVGIYFTTFGGFIALTAWLPTYWKSFFGLGSILAGFLTAFYALLSSLIRIPGGALADKFGGERIATASLMTMLFGALLLSFSQNILFSVMGIILMAVGMGAGNAAVGRQPRHPGCSAGC